MGIYPTRSLEVNLTQYENYFDNVILVHGQKLSSHFFHFNLFVWKPH